jgi:hypothetical protein
MIKFIFTDAEIAEIHDIGKLTNIGAATFCMDKLLQLVKTNTALIQYAHWIESIERTIEGRGYFAATELLNNMKYYLLSPLSLKDPINYSNVWGQQVLGEIEVLLNRIDALSIRDEDDG